MDWQSPPNSAFAFVLRKERRTRGMWLRLLGLREEKVAGLGPPPGGVATKVSDELERVHAKVPRGKQNPGALPEPCGAWSRVAVLWSRGPGAVLGRRCLPTRGPYRPGLPASAAAAACCRRRVAAAPAASRCSAVPGAPACLCAALSPSPVQEGLGAWVPLRAKGTAAGSACQGAHTSARPGERT